MTQPNKRTLISFILFVAPLFIYGQIADFKTNINKGCKPIQVNFTDLSTGNPTSWKWDLGNGNSSASPNPSALYVNPGIYTVTLTVSNSSGTITSSKTATITVYDNPTAGFNASPTSVCVGQAITFTDNSTLSSSPIKTWDWIFGDGSSQSTTASSIAHPYGFASSFPVTLIITDTNKCTANVTQNVTVTPGPTASFSASPTTQCAVPFTATFTNTSATTGTANYKWYFGDGSTSTSINPQHTYTTKGKFIVSLVVIQGACRDSIAKIDLINLKPIVADFKADTTKICVGQTVVFTDLSTPVATSRTWDFGDGGMATALAPSHTFTTAGIYAVSLKVFDANSCGDSIIKNAYINVSALPTASFTFAIQAGCGLPTNVNFTNTSSGASTWLWNFGDGNTSTLQNPVHAYTIGGNYTVQLIAKNVGACADTFQLSLGTLTFPKADFTASPQKGCIPLNVSFTSTSTSPDPIVNYDWDYGDGIASTTIGTTSHTYLTPGTYDVRLIITTQSGCKDTITKTKFIRTGTLPLPDFSIVDSTMCYGISAQFNNISSSGTTWLWTFGDGQSDTTRNPIHLYPDTGTFSVKLVAYNNGCADSITRSKIVTIYPPIPSFTFQINCSKHFEIQFNDATKGADSLSWNFGDGSFDNSNTKNPTHTYLTRGPRTVVLTAFNKKYGCSYSFSKNLIIADPKAKFAGLPLTGCYPLFTSFANTSIDGANYQWTFGDGNSSILNNASNTYNLPGRYNVRLIITDVNGCKDSLTRTNYINVLGPIPYFKADITKGCAPFAVQFTDTSRSDSALVQWTWDYGDGIQATTSVKGSSHLFAKPGKYSISMTVTDKNGCAKTLVKPDYIVPTFPQPEFTSDTLSCLGKIVNFDATPTISFTPTYKWDFADGTVAGPSGIGTIKHSYSNYGLYKVWLVVTDGNGCRDSIKHSVFIHKPKADFSDSAVSIGCGIKQVQFKDLSSGYVNGWKWDFGTGATSLSQNPVYTYTTAGYKTIKLIVTSIAGCTDTLVADSAILVPGPIGTFSFNPNTGCDPLKVTFKASSTTTENFTWDFGDGTVISTTSNTVVHTYNKDLSVVPILLLGTTLSDGSYCQLPAKNMTGAVVVSTVTAVSITPKIIKLQEGDYTYSNPITNITGPFSSQWTPMDGIDCPTCFNIIINSTGGDMTYALTVTDTAAGGCVARDTLRIQNVPCKEDFEIPNVFTPNNDGMNDLFAVKNLCAGYKFEMSIYNRWGGLISSTRSNNIGWDGKTITGEPAPAGTYYYVILIHAKPYTGFVQLLRN